VNIMKRMLIASAVSAAAMLSASAASATDYTITNVGLDGGALTLSGLVNKVQAAGLITITTNTGAVLPTFCVDLFHTIGIGPQNPPLLYTSGALEFDSNGNPSGRSGNPLTQPVTGEIQTLANIGAHEFVTGTGTADSYTALQGAIWKIEYGAALGVDGGALNGQIAADIALAQANPSSYANTLFPGAGGDPFGPGQALTQAPGPNVGEGLLGFAAMTTLLVAARYRGLIV
jgi:hypothetical protein